MTLEEELRELAKEKKQEIIDYTKDLENQGFEKREIAKKVLEKYSLWDIWFYFQSKE